MPVQGRIVASVTAVATVVAAALVAWAGPATAAATTNVATATTASAGYISLTPARLLDSRVTGVTVDGVSAKGGAINAGSPRTVQITGRGGVPSSGVGAVVLNVTAISPTSGTYLTVYPSGQAKPNASNLNLLAGQVSPNLVTVKVGTAGGITIANASGSVNVAADVAGYFPTGESYTPLTPGRLMDTRATGATVDGQFQGTGAITTGTVRNLQVTGRYGIPATGVDAVILNVTGIAPTAETYATVWPTGAAKPNASNLNLKAGEVKPNLVVAKLGSGGEISLANASGSMNMVADVAGWIPTGTSYTPLTPARLLDTRATGTTVDGIGAKGGAIGPGATRQVTVTGRYGIPATGVAAVVLNVTGVAPTTGTYATVFPSGITRPNASNLNLAKGEVRPNLVIAKVGTNGAVSIYNASGSVNMVADVAGWFASPPDTPAPSITTGSPLPAAKVGTAYSLTLAGAAGTTPYTWSLANATTLPAGLSLNAAGTISGTPTTSGPKTFTVKLTDSTTPASQTATKDLTITVNPADALRVSTTTLTDGAVGTAYSESLAAAGGTTPYSWSIVTGALPAGLSLNAATGAITGTPTTGGTASFTARATDSSTPTPQSLDKALSITVSTPVSITTTTLPDATATTAYNQSLAATGGTTPYTWSLTAGSLPAGLSLSAAGTVSGTATTPGTSTFTVKVTAGATTASKQLTLLVKPPPLVITTASTLPTGQQGSKYSAPLAASGGVAPYTWAVTAGTLPAGLWLTAAGVVTGTPASAGTSTFTARVTDSATSPVTTSRQFSLTVTVPPVVISPATLPDTVVGADYGYYLTITGGASDTCTLSVSAGSLPSGLTLEMGSGMPDMEDDWVFSGTPLVAGTSSFTLQANCGGTIGARSYSILVKDTPLAITTLSLSPASTEYSSYYGTLTAQGGTGPYTWSIATGAFPAGITLAPNGELTGDAPSTFAEGTATVRVTDNAGASVTKTLTLFVNEFGLYGMDPPKGTVGLAYSSPLIEFPDATIESWSATGALPPGLKVNGTTGLLTGTPTAAGTFAFVVQATSDTGMRAKMSVTVKIYAPGPAMAIATVSLPNGQVGTGYSAPIAVTGGNPGYTLEISAGQAPPGLYTNMNDCDPPGGCGVSLDGDPEEPGTFTFTLKATDDGGASVTKPYTVTIAPAPLTVTTANLTTGATGTAYQYSLRATGGIAPYTWSLVSGTIPAGLTLSGSGLITGTPTTYAATSLTVKVTDSTSATTTAAIRLLVNAPATASAVAAGQAHTCAVVGGKVRCWGDNSNGELGNATTGEAEAAPVEVSGLTTASKLAAGSGFTCALLTDKTVSCWGANADGQLGDGSTDDRSIPVTTGLTNATAISAGRDHACAVLNTAKVSCWGANKDGQIGTGTATGYPITVPTVVAGLSGVVTVSAGDAATCVTLTTGAVRCWGNNEFGQLGDGTYTNSATPVTALASGATKVSTDEGMSCALLSGGTVSCWGDSVGAPEPVAGVSGASSVSSNNGYACAQTATNVTCWGAAWSGQLGNGSTAGGPDPVTVTGISGTLPGSLSAGNSHACVVLTSGSVRCWGDNSTSQIGTGLTPLSLVAVPVAGIGSSASSVGVGYDHTCVVVSGGVRCWGDLRDSDFGQLGTGATQDPRWTPATITGLTGVTQVDSASGYSCARRSVGTVACWGGGGNGQLGDGSYTDSPTPLDVTGLSNAQTVTTGENHACALQTGGTVSCWGANYNGQLGNAAVDGSSGIPVPVPGLSGVTALTAGANHTCAVASGLVRCWGANWAGQLGNGTIADAASPTLVPGLTGAASVEAGSGYTCAVLIAGGVKCWGDNSMGQLGVGDRLEHMTPTTVVGISTATQLSAGEQSTCARLSNGAAQCWGSGFDGQLGTGDVTPSMTPRQVAGMTTAVELRVGWSTACARLASGALQCWGNGHLGDGSSSLYTLPQRPVGL